MKTAKLFKFGNSQAVRLPKAFRFEGDQVHIKQLGNLVVLTPYHAPWDSLVKSLKSFSPDFLEEREQPAVQDHEEFSE